MTATTDFVLAGEAVPASDVASAARERAAFGLDADYATVAALLASPQDVGTPRWGIAMTADESAVIDLPARFVFEAAIREQLIPYVESMAGFAGWYIDQENGGGLVVLSTTPVTPDELRPYVPAVSRGVSTRRVAHTFARLSNAVGSIADRWRLGEVPIRYVGVDLTGNGIDIGVSPADIDRALAAAQALSDQIGIPVSVNAVELPEIEACTSRDNCFNPMNTGIRVRKGSVTSSSICTRGFHVRKSGDEQWLTAGHCVIGGSIDWYHTGYGLVGETNQQWTLYFSNGIDVTRVDFNDDTQVSDDVYNDATDLYGYGNPGMNEVVCMSLGVTNTIDCGTVTDDWIQYSDGSGRTGLDGALGCCYSTQSGDSGSPVYRQVSGERALARGTHIGTWNPPSSTKLFTRIVEVLDRMGLTLVT